MKGKLKGDPCRALRAENVALKSRVEKLEKELMESQRYIERERAYMQGQIDGLKYAARCNGVSGAEVEI